MFPRVDYVPDITKLLHAIAPVFEDRDDDVSERRTSHPKDPTGTRRLGYIDHTMMILYCRRSSQSSLVVAVLPPTMLACYLVTMLGEGREGVQHPPHVVTACS